MFDTIIKKISVSFIFFGEPKFPIKKKNKIGQIRPTLFTKFNFKS